MEKLNECEMSKDDIVYGDYCYVAILEDGSEKVVQSHIHDDTVLRLINGLRRGEGWYDKPLKVVKLKTCDIFGRSDK